MIHEAWFVFKGIDSRKMGVYVTRMPETVRPERRIESITIAGRNGSLHTDDGVYESYDRTMECALKRRAKLDEVAAWLVGSGDIIFSTEPDKIYKITIANKVSIAQMMKTFQKFIVTMDTQPFKYSVNSFNDKKILTEPTRIKNRGTEYSQPVITVYGNGGITLTINGVDYPMDSVDNYITIDSEMMEVFKDSANQNSKFKSADFPRFETGENSISWTGDVDRVEIDPRWRWL